MKSLRHLIAALALTGAACITTSLTSAPPDQTDCGEDKVYGIAFYNLENLFDTINQSGNLILSSLPEAPAHGTPKNTAQNSRNLPLQYMP